MMTSRPSEPAIDGRLSAFLASELRRAEADFPLLPRRTRGRQPGARLLGLAVVAAGIVAAIALLRPFGGFLPTTPGGDPLGPDGLPRSIGGEQVLRGGDIDARLGSDRDRTSFLAGGYLVLRPVACGSTSPAPSEGCGEDWRLDDSLGVQPGHSFRLITPEGGATFVRTSGAATVFRVRRAVEATGCCTRSYDRRRTLLIDSVAWRQPTKGRIPPEAAPPAGGEIAEAFVPDFVSAWGGPTGETIVGYVPKALLLHPTAVVGGSPDNPPQPAPVPVYGEDLTTLVGHMVAGQGFVPLGTTPDPLEQPTPVPSAAPSMPAIECAEAAFDPPATLTCEEAIDNALSALPPAHAQVLTASFTYQLPCGARLGCPYLWRGDIGFVIITSADGAELIRVVKAISGAITASPPEPYVPPR